jgi:hypothetical protein
MQTIYEIGAGSYWTGASQDIAEHDGAAPGWTRTPPPELADGEFAVWGGQGWAIASDPYVPAQPTITGADVDAERDRRIEAGMVWLGVRYQTRQQDRENVHGAATMALAAMATGGGLPGDLRWHGGVEDFVWIAEDNTLHTFDAPGFFAFAKGMAAHKSALIFAARAIKDLAPIPADFADDGYWP